ncbi:MAG TPA: ShlB/FhaC/HecB family hemolysin secretion/activation protein [Candidatus Omnitrophota bacterium]|nr:ShlB/FhaC/HecB family hemolysin secretion/activation protein [Candidatus Omnitrophota bacterium]HPT39706.1 ShlB/FhaC/HecB family hemolysin secretion/activation protein [Candidatus Omnitrophota bacterium]
MNILKAKRIFFIALTCIFIFKLNSYAIEPQQTAGGLEKLQEDQARSKKLEQRVGQKKEKPTIEEKDQVAAPVPEGEKVLVKKINVEGGVLLSPAELNKIVAPYENKKLSIGEMQKVADLITDLYRTKNYPTSRAYIPPQTIGKDGVMVIRIVEGKVGDISVKGNKYFKSRLYKKKLQLKQNDPFNYSSLQRSLTLINERPDRFAKVILVPGKTPGSTDIVIEAKDYLPIHVGYTHDNYGSRYVGRDRDAVTFEHNNLLGFDDQLYFQFMRSEDSLSTLKSGRYLFPVNDSLNLGVNASYAKTKLGREFADLDSLGKSTIMGVFLNQTLISTETLDFRLNLGFDYKKIRNYLAGVETSRDDARVVKFGFDLDNIDNYGRTLLTAELDNGIPQFMGGLDAKDARATRIGAGGRFTKGVFNLYRSQNMPFSSNLLFKNSAQYTHNTLTAAEEFQLGGPYSVRGYAPGEVAGDRGLYSAVEWSCPYYFIPKKLKIPMTKETWYDTTRFVIFYDWGTTRSNSNEETIKTRTLNSAGLGFRFSLTNRISAKFELAWPLGGPRSSDTSRQHVQPWIEFTAKL